MPTDHTAFGCHLPVHCSDKRHVLCNMVSISYGCFIDHPLTDLFIHIPYQLLWEIFSHATNTAQKLPVHVYLLLSITRCSLTWLNGLKKIGMKKFSGYEIPARMFKTASFWLKFLSPNCYATTINCDSYINCLLPHENKKGLLGHSIIVSIVSRKGLLDASVGVLLNLRFFYFYSHHTGT